MSKARQLADLLDSNGDVVVGALDNAPDPDLTPYATTTYVDTEIGNVDLSTRVATSGDTMTGDLNFSDNVKAQFGASNDLQISHNGSHSIIQDTGTGNLYVSGTELALVNGDFSQTYALFNSNGGSNLYHNNASKLSTTSTGVAVTGDMTLSSNGAVNSELRSDWAGLQLGTTSNHYLAFRTNNTERMRLDTSGNLSVSGTISCPSSFSSIGTYAVLLWNNNGNYGAPVGATTSGSNLAYNNQSGSSASDAVSRSGWHIYQGSMYRGGNHDGGLAGVSGTWRNMGIGPQGRSNDDKSYALWVRTA